MAQALASVGATSPDVEVDHTNAKTKVYLQYTKNQEELSTTEIIRQPRRLNATLREQGVAAGTSSSLLGHGWNEAASIVADSQASTKSPHLERHSFRP